MSSAELKNPETSLSEALIQTANAITVDDRQGDSHIGYHLTSAPQRFGELLGHAPQGMIARGRLVAIASVVKSCEPSDTAFTSAVRSAHHVRPRLAFATLQPVKIRPSLARSAAPTWIFEYGL